MSTAKGVTAIKSFLTIILAFATQAIQSFADGVQGTDFADFFDEGIQLATNSKVFKELGPEIKDGLSEAEYKEVFDHVKNEFVKKQLGVKFEPQLDAFVTSVVDAALANAKAVYRGKELIAAIRGVPVEKALEPVKG